MFDFKGSDLFFRACNKNLQMHRDAISREDESERKKLWGERKKLWAVTLQPEPGFGAKQ